MLDRMAELERRGGATDDGWKTIRGMDRLYPYRTKFSRTPREQCIRLGIEPGSFKALQFWDAMGQMSHNLDANPGPTWKMCGFDKKRESLAVASDVAHHIYQQAAVRPIVGYLKPKYSLAGRTKLQTRDKARAKAGQMKPFGRAVFMADQHEALLASIFTTPFMKETHKTLTSITIGFNKFGDDPTRMAQRLRKHNLFINGDFSSFDTKCSAQLIIRAFSVLRCAFGLDAKPDSQDSRVMDWLEDQFVNKHVVLPTGGSVLIPNGVPSGSGFTAIIDSIICHMMWDEALDRIGVGERELFTHGDDNLVGLSIDGPVTERRAAGAEIVYQASKIIEEEFGHELSTDKTLVSSRLFVAFAQPRVANAIEDRSTEEVAKYRRELSRKLGRRLTFNETHELLDREPIGPAPGNTHRWTYVFNDRARFLSHYFKPDPSSGAIMMVRPTKEVVENILYPESKVNTLDKHEERLISAWVENMGNHHVVNKVMHYIYDSYQMRKMGVYNRAPPPGGGKRAWYRHVDGFVDLLMADDEFAQYYAKLHKRALKAHGRAFGLRYTSWEYIRALRKGRTRITVGGPITRYPSSTEMLAHITDSQLYNDLGPLGFTLWSKHDLRQSLGQLFITALDKPTGSIRSDDFSGLYYFVRNLRTDLNSDFQGDWSRM